MTHHASGAELPPSPGLLAGATTVDITPTTPQWLDGYGNRVAPSEGVYLPIHARALYLAAGGGEALLVTAEILAYDRPQAARVRAAIAAAAGIDAAAVILAATHTHCAPRVCGTVMPGEVDPDYRDWFEARLVAAAVAARARPVPVRLALSRGTGTLGVNRRVRTEAGTIMRPNPAGMNDPSITTAWFEARDGVPVASLTVYACHPTSRGGALIGGDYPGFLSDALEARGGGHALFVLGCAGDLRPRFTNDGGGFRMAAIPEVETAGRALAEEVWRHRDEREWLPVGRVAVAGEEVALPFGPRPTAEELVAIAARDKDPLRRLWAERMLAVSVVGLPAAAPFEVQVLAVSPAAAWIFMAGEMVVDFARALARRAGPAVIPAGYANGSVGYVPSRRIYPEGGYEVAGAYHYYGQPAPFTEEAEDLVLAAARRQLATALEETP
jgi:hypothetical protein